MSFLHKISRMENGFVILSFAINGILKRQLEKTLIMPNEKELKIAEKMALKLGFDGVKFIKQDEDSYIFEAFSKELACSGLPSYVIVKNGDASFYTGFKYMK